MKRRSIDSRRNTGSGGAATRTVRRLLSALLLVSAAPWAGAEEVPFDDPRWSFEADSAELVEHAGEEALRLHRGRAWLPDVEITDGVIEFDFAFGPERSFSGAMFRFQRPGDFENFYFRPHQSGNPDASQYTPEVNGVSGWQLYHGPEFSPPFRYRFGEWMHVEIAFAGSQATVSLDGDAYLLPTLKRPVQAGAIGIRSGYAPAWFANFRYSESVPADFPDGKPPETEPPPEIEGLVARWRVSEAFPTAERPEGTLDDGFRDRFQWRTEEVEPEGFVNLAWSRGVDHDHRTVLAELAIDAEETGHRLVRFGYSDSVRVFVGGEEIYRGDNGYRTRDYRYLGTIGLFDTVVVPVSPGENVVTFAVTERFGGWGIMAAVSPLGPDSEARIPGSPILLSRVAEAYADVSPDGTRIAFMSDAAGSFDVYTMASDGSDRRRLTDGPGREGTPIWSPDGRRIAYQTVVDGNSEISVMDADGSNRVQVTDHPATDMHPTWSPDAERILFNSSRDDEEGIALFTVAADGSDLRRLTDPAETRTYASWSPDGRRMVFVRWLPAPEGERPDGEIVVADPEARTERNLTRNSAFDGWPSWSPDGSRIAFASNRSGAYRIYVMDTDGDDVTRVTSEGPHYDTQPSWTPDGESLVFTRYESFDGGGPEEASRIHRIDLGER